MISRLRLAPPTASQWPSRSPPLRRFFRTARGAGQDPRHGLPLPRFVSLKSNDVNVRRGPGQEYDVAYTYVRAGLPVEITQEFDNWRKIRDSEGAEGWVFHSLLAGKRTALVAPWEKSGPFAAYASARRQGGGGRVS